MLSPLNLISRLADFIWHNPVKSQPTSVWKHSLSGKAAKAASLSHMLSTDRRAAENLHIFCLVFVFQWEECLYPLQSAALSLHLLSAGHLTVHY